MELEFIFGGLGKERERDRERVGEGRSSRYLPSYSTKHIEGLGVGLFYNIYIYFYVLIKRMGSSR